MAPLAISGAGWMGLLLAWPAGSIARELVPLLLALGWVAIAVGWHRLARRDRRFGVAIIAIILAAFGTVASTNLVLVLYLSAFAPVDPLSLFFFVPVVLFALCHLVAVVIAADGVRRIAADAGHEGVRRQALAIEYTIGAVVSLTLGLPALGLLVGLLVICWFTVLQLAIARRPYAQARTPEPDRSVPA